jgi:hypothetical protein
MARPVEVGGYGSGTIVAISGSVFEALSNKSFTGTVAKGGDVMGGAKRSGTIKELPHFLHLTRLPASSDFHAYWMLQCGQGNVCGIFFVPHFA